MKIFKALIFFFCSITAANATIHNVPSAFSTISSALNACQNFDTVLVASGTYFENIQWPSTKGIRLIGASGSDSTIIDGNNIGRVLSIEGDTLTDSTIYIKGFTIQNGKVEDTTLSYLDCIGGGIYISKCCANFNDLIIKHNVLSGNSHSYGAGIYTDSSNIYLTDCLFSHNTINLGEWSYGGGLFTRACNVTIMQCSFVNNELIALGWADGGGLYFEYSEIEIDQSEISHNKCTAPRASGGGLYTFNGTFQLKLLVSNTRLDSNRIYASFGGNGGAISVKGDADLINLLIINNYIDTVSQLNSGSGAGLNVSNLIDTPTVNIINCTFANNYRGRSGYNSIRSSGSAVKMNAINCIIWSTTSFPEINEYDSLFSITNCNIKNSILSGINGNISSNPRFVSSNDFHLQAGSPCLNAGTLLLNYDLDGNPRPLPAGSNSDIGCYEMDEILLRTTAVDQEVFEIYPNPTSDYLNVKILDLFSFEIYNLNGQIILKDILETVNNSKINIITIPEGVYVLKITTQNGKVFSSRFLKKGS